MAHTSESLRICRGVSADGFPKNKYEHAQFKTYPLAAFVACT